MLLRQTLGYLPAQILGPLAQLLSIIAWTHLANEQVIGVVTWVTVTQDLLSQIGLLWWTGYLMRFYRAPGQDQEKLLAASMMVVAISVLIQGPLAIFNLLVFVDPNADIGFCAAVFAFVALRGINTYNLTLATIRERPLDYSIYALFGPVGGLAIGVGCLAAFGPSPFWPIFGYAVGEALAALYGFARARINLSLLGVRAIIMAGVAFGLPVAISSGLEWLVLNLPRYAVDHALGIEAVGLYAVGFGLGMRATTLAAMAVSVASYPLAIRRSEEDGHGAAMRQVGDNLALLVGVMAPCLVGLALVNPPLVRMAIGEAYWASTIALLPVSLLAGALTALTVHFLHHIILLEKRTWLLVGSELATVAITAACVFPALDTYGVQGAVLAIVVGRAVVGLPLVIYFMTKRGLVLPWRSLFYVTCATGAMSGAVLAIPQDREPELLWLCLRIGAGAFAYFGVIAFCYRDWMKERLRRVSSRLGGEAA